MQWWCYILLGFTLVSMIKNANGRLRGGGTLKVRIGRFSNLHNKLANGNCCSLYRTAPTCRGSCRTFFRICTTYSPRPLILRKTPKFPINLSTLIASADLSNRNKKSGAKNPFYQQSKQNYSFEPLVEESELQPTDPDQSNDIDDAPSYIFSSSKRDEFPLVARSSDAAGLSAFLPCTFGVVVTDVVAGSSLEAEKDGVLEVDFPFKSPWPLTFRLIIEAWNEVTPNTINEGIARMEGNKTGILISRHESRHTLQGNEGWRPFRYELDEGREIHYSLRVPCKAPFFGHKCSMRCDNLRTSQNNRINCSENGDVTCLEGWTGDMCNKAVCRDGCHSIHGYCTQPGECKCALGWRGKNCDECVPLPGCKHGFCSNTSYECICEQGWEGSYCSIPVCREGCHSARGYCKLPGECRCRIGWGGETCDSCRSLPGCDNGFCTKPLECRCRPGWTGILCDEPICKSNCSAEHGTCTKPGECRCEVGWWGKNCDTCFPYPGCKHGNCENPWECNCETGWTGMTCNERQETGGTYCDSHSNTCLNGGTCINVPDERNYTCSCPALFTGKQCDYLAHGRASFFPIINRGSLAARSTFSTVTPLSQNLDATTTERPSTTPTITTTEPSTTSDELQEGTMSVSISTSFSMSTSPENGFSSSPESIISASPESTFSPSPEIVASVTPEPSTEVPEPSPEVPEPSPEVPEPSPEVPEPSRETYSSTDSLENTDDNETFEKAAEPKSSKMTLKVTKIGPVNKDGSETPDEPTTKYTKAEEGVPEMLQQESETSISLNQNNMQEGLENKRRKYMEGIAQKQNETHLQNLSISKQAEERTSLLPPPPPSKEADKKQEFVLDFPNAEDLYSEILKTVGVKLTSNSDGGPNIQTPVLILQIRDHRGMDPEDDSDSSNSDSDSNNAKANLITGRSRFLRHHDSFALPSEDQSSSLPILVTQDVPQPASLSSSPFSFSTDFDSLSQASSLYPYGDYSDLPPQTRINRRTGQVPHFVSSSPLRRIPSNPTNGGQTTAASEIPKSREKDRKEVPRSYYEEHYDGRVHIGDVTEVDRHSPLEEIVDAFIELKKLTS